MTTPDAAQMPQPPWPAEVPPERYGGEGIQWSMARMAETDKDAIRRLYAAITDLLAVQTVASVAHDVKLDLLVTWMKRVDWQTLRRDVAAVGNDTYAEFGADPTLRKVIHDFRGGPLTSFAEGFDNTPCCHSL